MDAAGKQPPWASRIAGERAAARASDIERRSEVAAVASNGAPPRLPENRHGSGRVTEGLSKVWSLAKAAQRITLRLAFDPDTDPDLSMTYAGMDIREVLEELEWSHPESRLNASPVDIGQPPWEEAAARDTVARLLVAALDATTELLVLTSGSSAAQTVMFTRVVQLLGAAHGRATHDVPNEL